MKTRPGHPPPASARAFSLIEVMVATTIFFMAMFSILGVLCAGIHAASILRTSGPTAGMAAGYYYVTNQIVEGSDAGDFSDIAGYQGYQWRSTAVEVATNGLFKMDFVVTDPHGNPSSTLEVLIYNPASSSRNHLGLQSTPH
jgi:Tfp pilus assembly protein PilV